MNTKLEWIILATQNYHKSHNFYKNILQLSVIRNIPEEEFTQFKLDNCYLAIYGRKFFKKLLAINIPPAGSAIYTFAETNNIDSLYRKLQNSGIKFILPPATQPWGQRTAYFRDPDGHIWEIQQWLKK